MYQQSIEQKIKTLKILSPRTRALKNLLLIEL